MRIRILISVFLLVWSAACCPETKAQADEGEEVHQPRALRPGIEVRHFASVEPQAVRILHHPVSGELWYTTFDGNVFRLKGKEKPVSEKVLSVTDHGINRLQGAAFYKNTLFLTGNVDKTEKKATSGRIVCFDFLPSGAIKKRTLMNTVAYATNKTTYDHGWNALEVSPDGKYIYVNSGARTDHGEVQDNDGAFPNARDNALTSKVFRFPINAHDLFLEDNEAALKRAGYIYAEGIRNAYDMAFDKKGNLFGVSNSPDYDMPEDMFWIRKGHHYGFPWVMGGLENPQQYSDWSPNPDVHPFVNRFSHSWTMRYFHQDSSFPALPDSLRITRGVLNQGPDANEYRGHSGKILDGDQTGMLVSTFTAHCSPLGLFFDNKDLLADEYKGDGFVLRYTLGARSPLMMPFTKEGADLLHLKLSYDKATDNYFVQTKRIVDGFKEPTDAVLVHNTVYVIEYGGDEGGNIWQINLPSTKKPAGKK